MTTAIRCHHKLPISNGYSRSLSGKSGGPASVRVWCGRCKAAIPATTAWLDRYAESMIASVTRNGASEQHIENLNADFQRTRQIILTGITP